VTALAVVAVAAIVVAGGLMASNMGFKLNFPLTGPSPGVSNSGSQLFGLPYNQQVGINTVSQLLADIQTNVPGAFQIQRFNPVTDGYDAYPGAAGDFTLVPAEALLVRTTASGSYIIVGSHDPGYNVQFKAPSPGVSNSGSQIYVHPYHGTASNALDLITETGAFQLQRFNPVTDGYDAYPGAAGNFTLVPGEGYLMRVTADQSFIPAHY
jgi:hypothetical protein